MQTVVNIALWTLSLYLLYCGSLFLLQRQVLFPRYQIEVPSGMPATTRLEKLWLEGPYGKVEAWFMPPAADLGEGAAPAVIFSHGNAELIDFWPEELRPFTRLGIGVLLVEYPGYGRSKGTPSQRSITEAFVSAYDFLTTRNDVDMDRIVLFGRSIGGGAVCALAAERPSAALVLMSAFTSVKSFAVNFLVPTFLIRDPFDNLKVLKSYAGPTLVIHGTSDSIIPYSHGLALFQAARHGKMISYDSGHNDCPPNWNTFWQDMESFLRTAGILKN